MIRILAIIVGLAAMMIAVVLPPTYSPGQLFVVIVGAILFVAGIVPSRKHDRRPGYINERRNKRR